MPDETIAEEPKCKSFVTGANGFIGGAVAATLIAAGPAPRSSTMCPLHICHKGTLLHPLTPGYGTTRTGANAAACPHPVEAEMRA
jgi:hypothetical protein